MKNIMIIGMLFLSMTYAVTTSTEVVVDSKTKLEWQNEAVNKTESKSWQESINYCQNLNLDGKDDWRLANINELKSLIDYDTNTLLIVSALRETTSDTYWSSTTYPKDSTKSFFVDFFTGTMQSNDKQASTHFRCVRDK